MYCRFCTRKRATMVRGGWDAISRNDERMIEYVRNHPEIRDVIVSGGDPLTLPASKLRFFLDNLAAIPHVDVVRIGTRVPVTLPQKLYDRDLIKLLASAGKVWIQTHFNHPREVTPEAARVCNALEIIEGLRGHLSGLGIPTYVVDSPHGGGKIPMMPNYLVSFSDDAVVLRNYEG